MPFKNISSLVNHNEMTGFCAQKAKEIFDQQMQANYAAIDRMFSVLLFIEWLSGIITALLLSPTAWEGVSSSPHIHVLVSIWLGLAIVALPIGMAWLAPGATTTRHTIAIGQILMTALLIHLTGGRLETHFLIFGSLTFLAFYTDWTVLLTASILVALDHILRGIYLPFSVYGVTYVEPWRWMEHSAWVVFADIFLVNRCIMDIKERWRVAERQAKLEMTNEIIESEVVHRTFQVTQSEERFRNLCMSVPMVIFESDKDGGWEVVGMPWFQLTSSPISRGKEWWTLLVEVDRDRTLESWKLALRQGTEWAQEFRIRTDSGEVKWVRGKAVPYSTGGTSSRRLIGTLEDITDRRDLEDNSRKMMLMNQRDDFMAMLANDLKNPIVGSNRVLSMLTEGKIGSLAKEHQQLLVKLIEGNDELLGMIEHIISVYRYDRDVDADEFENANIANLIKDSIKQFSTALADRNIKLLINIGDEDALCVKGNNESIRIVLVNLMDNALKFTPENGTIEILAHRQEDSVMLKINNSGSRIEGEQRSKLFERPITGEEGSGYLPKVGLGLYMCRQIVDAHKGQISCSSDSQQGTTFIISLPHNHARETSFMPV
ncbi:MAG: PAS domain-containing sensor histidine kinase [Leptolyngbya sp.]|nr:PAS domain-containing sensor histidine kinase [Candidatus Melainabacteria bacterium]